jgi:putative oxidoreductase
MTIPVGRLLIGLGFATFGLWNIGNHAALSGLIGSRRLPLPDVAAAVGIITQITGGLLLTAGLWTRLSALALITFVIGATLLAHIPLGTEPAQRRENIVACLMNVIVIGGLLSCLQVSA